MAEGIFSLVGKSDAMADGWGANQGFVVTSDGVVVIDTGFTRPRARELWAEVKRATDAPPRIIVNTHDHSDHVFGNSTVADGSIPIFSHANCRRRLVKLGNSRVEGYRKLDEMRGPLEGLSIVPPQVTFDSEMAVKVCDTEIRFIHPGHAHTSGDTMVHLPGRKVLFAGDVLWEGYHPNLEDGSVPGWVSALGRVIDMDLNVVVPGHGRPTGKRSAKELAGYLKWFDSGLKEAARRGLSAEDAARTLQAPGSDRWKLGMIVRRNAEVLLPRYRARLTKKRTQTR